MPARSEARTGMSSPIEDYALIGDLHTGALVGRDGSIDWLCLPNFDSPACFAALLDTPDAGRRLLAPSSSLASVPQVTHSDVPYGSSAVHVHAVSTAKCTRRQYRGDTLVLETEWHTPSGDVKVTDFMPPRTAAVDVVRIVEGISGSVEMHSELVLRFDYGRVVPWVRQKTGGIEAIAGPDAVWLRTPVDLHGAEQTTVSTFTVREGEHVPFVLTWAPSHRGAPARSNADDLL